MSYSDAIRDSIRIKRNKEGFNQFYPPCAECGKPVAVWRYEHGAKYLCPKCKELQNMIQKISVLRGKHRPRFRNALDRL